MNKLQLASLANEYLRTDELSELGSAECLDIRPTWSGYLPPERLGARSFLRFGPNCVGRESQDVPHRQKPKLNHPPQVTKPVVAITPGPGLRGVQT
jgi:hypothetical protein